MLVAPERNFIVLTNVSHFYEKRNFYYRGIAKFTVGIY